MAQPGISYRLPANAERCTELLARVMDEEKRCEQYLVDRREETRNCWTKQPQPDKRTGPTGHTSSTGKPVKFAVPGLTSNTFAKPSTKDERQRLENTIQPSLNEDVSFETILSAWQSATDRLQETHRELRDEVRRLSDELELKNRELERQNRLADLGQMAAHVAHEIRNGLMPITLYLSQLERRLNGHPLHVETVRDLKLIDKIKSDLAMSS